MQHFSKLVGLGGIGFREVILLADIVLKVIEFYAVVFKILDEFVVAGPYGTAGCAAASMIKREMPVNGLSTKTGFTSLVRCKYSSALNILLFQKLTLKISSVNDGVLLKNSKLFIFNDLCKLSEQLLRTNFTEIFGRNQS